MSDDFAFEPVRGLPEHLPDGERMLWQGAPDWRSLAIHAFHVRKVAIYFGLLVVWRMFAGLWEGEAFAVAATASLWLVALGAAAVGLLGVFAWLVARTTVYTVTSKRLVTRFGIALPMTINVPFALVEAADLRAYPDGTGEIPLTLVPSERIAYLVLWPHARPWHFARPKPTLRCVPDAVRVARLVAGALAALAGRPASAIAEPDTARDVAAGRRAVAT